LSSLQKHCLTAARLSPRASIWLGISRRMRRDAVWLSWQKPTAC